MWLESSCRDGKERLYGFAVTHYGRRLVFCFRRASNFTVMSSPACTCCGVACCGRGVSSSRPQTFPHPGFSLCINGRYRYFPCFSIGRMYDRNLRKEWGSVGGKLLGEVHGQAHLSRDSMNLPSSWNDSEFVCVLSYSGNVNWTAFL